MTIENRSQMERAIGIISGLSYTVEERIQDALLNVCEMLDAILNNEKELIYAPHHGL